MFIATVAFVIVRANSKNIKAASTQNTNNTTSQKGTKWSVSAQVGEEDAIAEEAKLLELTDEEKEEGEKTVSSNTGYYIKVNYQANCLTVYRVTDSGELQPIKAIICSTGRATPRSGVYSLKAKRRWWQLMGGVWGQYTTQVVGNILMHSVPYLSQDPSNLEYWEYDKLGTACSAGCIRLTVGDALWIYNNMPSGTPVEFYGSSDPGPLGKPGARKISDNEECRGWDPTDPDPDNPWRGQIQEEEESAPEPAPAPAPTPEPVNQNTNNNQSQNHEQNNNQNQNTSSNQNENENQSGGQNQGGTDNTVDNTISGNQDNNNQDNNDNNSVDTNQSDNTEGNNNQSQEGNNSGANQGDGE